MTTQEYQEISSMCEALNCKFSKGLKRGISTSWFAPLLAALVLSPISIEIVIADSAVADRDSTQATAELTVIKPAKGQSPAPKMASPASERGHSSGSLETSSHETGLAETASEGEFQQLDSQSAAGDDEAPTHASRPASGQKAAGVRTLSVEPSLKPLLPDDHPQWITAPADYDSPVHRLAVGSIPTSLRASVDESLDEPLLAAVYNYIDEQIVRDDFASSRIRSKVTLDYIRKNLIDDPLGYVAELHTSEGPMYQKWVAVTVSPAQRQQLARWVSEAVQRDRLQPIGIGLLAVICLVGMSHMALRRRHGLPPAQPVKPHEMASAPVVPTRRSRGIGATLAGLFCLFVFVGSLLFALMFVVRTSRQSTISEVVHEQIKTDAVLEEATRTQRRLEGFTPHAPVVPAPPRVPPLQDHGSEMRIETGNQSIIIRTGNR